MRKILITAGLLLGLIGYAYSGWIEENAANCMNALYCGTITVYTSITAAAITATGTITGVKADLVNAAYGVKVSTAATSGSHVYYGGAVAALPTSGYAAGSIVVNSADEYKVYIATHVVTATTSWALTGSQS